MAMASVAGIFGLIIYLFVLMLPIALLVALQVWLCRKSTRLGLILPGTVPAADAEPGWVRRCPRRHRHRRRELCGA